LAALLTETLLNYRRNCHPAPHFMPKTDARQSTNPGVEPGISIKLAWPLKLSVEMIVPLRPLLLLTQFAVVLYFASSLTEAIADQIAAVSSVLEQTLR
jgi:hypothetical protein